MAFLELAGVCKGYGADPCAVLRGVNLEIDRGELVAIVGASGTGKTTLLSMVAGLLAPSRGQVVLDGRVVTRPGPDRAVVFQSYSLLPWMTVLANVQLAVDQVHPGWPAAARRERAEEMIALVNLTAARAKLPHELSGGMRQRTSLARALAADPEVLLMDEPLGALDAFTRATLQDEIERIWRRDRKTALLVTNDVDEALRLADRIVPLGGRPGATLLEPIAVDFARPRDRRVLELQPAWIELRERVVARLRLTARPASEPVRPQGALALEVAA
jgi:nitrate/nitrite transport system ATP-binding protein